MINLPNPFRRTAPQAADALQALLPLAWVASAVGATDVAAGSCGPAGCGWFDSSWDLRAGLAVVEMPASDWPVAALWFGSAAFADAAQASARLQ